MSGAYSFSEYYSLVLFVCASILVVCFAWAFYALRNAMLHTPRPSKYLTPFLIHVAVLFPVLFWAMPVLSHINNITPPNLPVFQQQAGQVQHVKRFGWLPYHYTNNGFRYGTLVTIDGIEYYMIEDSRITPGEYLLFSAEIQDYLIVSWETIDKEEADAFQPVPPAQLPQGDEKTNPPPAAVQTAGRVISIFGLILFGGLLFAQSGLYAKRIFWLAQKDILYCNGVVPNFFALRAFWTVGGAIAFIVLGGCMQSNNYTAIVFLALAFCVICAICYLEMQVRVKIIGHHLLITSLGRNEQLPLGNITDIHWSYRRTKNSIRALVVTFRDRKELVLPQDTHWGLTDLYDRLCKNCPNISK